MTPKRVPGKAPIALCLRPKRREIVGIVPAFASAVRHAVASRATVGGWITGPQLPMVRIDGRRHIRPADLAATQARSHVRGVAPARPQHRRRSATECPVQARSRSSGPGRRLRAASHCRDRRETPGLFSPALAVSLPGAGQGNQPGFVSYEPPHRSDSAQRSCIVRSCTPRPTGVRSPAHTGILPVLVCAPLPCPNPR